MYKIFFDEPVTIETMRIGHVVTITNAAQAADYLMNQWPHRKGSKHRAALQEALDVLDHGAGAVDARQALIVAAEDAEMLVRE